MRFHGVLVEVGGVGVLLSGPSGIGKSECAVELVSRGARFVADDAVELQVREGRLWGCASEAIGAHLQIRGLGILSMEELYGASAVAQECPVDLLCCLGPTTGAPDSTGLEPESEALLGIQVRRVVLTPPRAVSLATLVDVAARDHRGRGRGSSAAARFEAAWLARTRAPS